MLRTVRLANRAKAGLIGLLSILFVGVLAATPAKAWWDYQYFAGFSYANQVWGSAEGTTYGGAVNVGLSSWGGLWWVSEYIGTYDWYSGAAYATTAGPGGDWIYLNHDGDTYSDSQCWWNSWSDSGQPQLVCDQYRD